MSGRKAKPTAARELTRAPTLAAALTQRERAAVVAWLRWCGDVRAVQLAHGIEAGEHHRQPAGEPACSCGWIDDPDRARKAHASSCAFAQWYTRTLDGIVANACRAAPLVSSAPDEPAPRSAEDLAVEITQAIDDLARAHARTGNGVAGERVDARSRLAAALSLVTALQPAQASAKRIALLAREIAGERPSVARIEAALAAVLGVQPP